MLNRINILFICRAQLLDISRVTLVIIILWNVMNLWGVLSLWNKDNEGWAIHETGNIWDIQSTGSKRHKCK